MGTSVTAFNNVASKLTNLMPNRRPPEVFASGAELKVLRPGDHRVPATPVGTVPATDATLRLMSYNVWGLQGPIGERQKERMSQIGPAVTAYDVVALQETFTKHSAAVGRLSQHTYQVKGSDGGWLRGSSGLTMLTSHAVLARDFIPFEKTAQADRLSQKGVLFMRIQVPGTGPVDVYSTHFQAGGAPDLKDHDVDQIVKLVKRHDQGYPTFVMGDLNLTPDEPQYQRLLKLLDLRDVYAEKHPDQPGATSSPQNTNHQPTDKAERIDYMLVRRNDRYDIAITSADVGMTEKVGGKHPSDHFAVIGQFRITPKQPPTPVSPLSAALRAVGAGQVER